MTDKDRYIMRIMKG